MYIYNIGALTPLPVSTFQCCTESDTASADRGSRNKYINGGSALHSLSTLAGAQELPVSVSMTCSAFLHAGQVRVSLQRLAARNTARAVGVEPHEYDRKQRPNPTTLKCNKYRATHDLSCLGAQPAIGA